MSELTSKRGTFHSKWTSYISLASSFLLYNSHAEAQCGTANSFNPVLGIDIDGDGNDDLSLTWRQGFSVSPFPLSSNNFTNATILGPTGISSYMWNFPPIGTISSCPVVNNPNGSQGYMGVYYGAYVNQLTTTFSLDTSFKYFGATGIRTASYIAGGLIGSAYANAGNQIIGLTASGSNICSLINASGSSMLNLGSAAFYSIFGNDIINNYASRVFFREAVYATIIGTLTSHTPVTCTVLAPIPAAPTTIGLYYPLNIPAISYSAALGTTLPIVVPFNDLNIISNNNNNTEYIGVKFQGPDQDGDGNPDHYYGWAEIFIHPDSRLTCLGTGYNSCSEESAIAAGASSTCPGPADIAAGMPDPMNNCVQACASMIVLSGTPSSGTDIESQDWIQSTQTLPAGASIDYDAVDYVELRSGFCAPPTTNFAAFIDQCNNGGGGYNVNGNEAKNN